MKKEKKIVLFVSGKGSNARAVIQFSQLHGGYEVTSLYASSPQSPALEMAAQSGVAAACLTDADLAGTSLFEKLNRDDIALVVLAGFLRKIPPSFLEGFNGRVINIHPSLLPAHGGAGMYGIRVHQAVLDAGDLHSGCTVHFVDEGYDTGPLIAQQLCEVRPEDSADTLAARVLSLEHDLLPRTIADLLKE